MDKRHRSERVNERGVFARVLADLAAEAPGHNTISTDKTYQSALHGLESPLVSDNGTDLTSNANLKWQEDRKFEWHCIAPGKPMQNSFVE